MSKSQILQFKRAVDDVEKSCDQLQPLLQESHNHEPINHPHLAGNSSKTWPAGQRTLKFFSFRRAASEDADARAVTVWRNGIRVVVRDFLGISSISSSSLAGWSAADGIS
jgi:hypothetical protein